MWNRILTYLRRWLTAACRAATRQSTALPQPPAENLPAAPSDAAAVQTLVAHVAELTTAVSQDVGQHHQSIQSINNELTAVVQGDASAVAAAVAKLLAANHNLQSRLERAELKLQAHSRQLSDAVTAARTDSLTGLMNRRALDEVLSRCVAECQSRQRPSALMLLDVDHFKRFNDALGHVAGDRALVHVADVLRAGARGTDVVARFGGEEFAIVFANATTAAIHERAEAVRRALAAQALEWEGREVRVTASAGLADAIEGDDIDAWLKRADEALYAAKRDGRNCTFWHNEDGLQRVELATDGPQPADSQPAAVRWREECSVELAAEAFADATFVKNVSRRIAEWKRGGATFSVLLARLDEAAGGDDVATQPAMRAAMHLARNCVRDMDLLTRWTSHGLAVLLPGAGAADAKVAARRLHAAVTAWEPESAEEPQSLSLCMGIAEGIEGNDSGRVLQRAWLALETAQQTGPGSIFIHDGIRPQAVKVAAAIR
jgi:diguanylate cyclase (GGDEF)-like protein